MLNTQSLLQWNKSLFTMLFLAVATLASAQVDQTAELKVTIRDVITFTLNDVNPTLIFDEADDFVNGVGYKAALAGTVTASGAFSISVKADKKDLKDSAGNKISAKSISIEASGAGLGTVSKVALDDDAQDIISGAPAGIAKTFDLAYSTVGNDTEFIGKPAGDYTVDLIFTATLD